MCLCSLISTRIIYTRASRHTHEYDTHTHTAMKRHTRAHTPCSLFLLQQSRLSSGWPSPAYWQLPFCSSLGMDLSSKMFQVSKQDRDGEERVMSWKRSSIHQQWGTPHRFRFTLLALNAKAVAEHIYRTYIQKRKRFFVCLFASVSMLQRDTRVSLQCWRVRVRRSQSYIIKREEVGDLAGASPPLIAVLRTLRLLSRYWSRLGRGERSADPRSVCKAACNHTTLSDPEWWITAWREHCVCLFAIDRAMDCGCGVKSEKDPHIEPIRWSKQGPSVH